jgi:hypothetical protein
MMSSTARRYRPWIGLAILGALAICFYVPYRARPFDIIDFSDILPLLTGSNSAAGQFARLVRYYGQEQGRFNVLSYAGMVMKWQLFGNDPLAWQLVRAAQLLLAMAGTYLLCRRLAAGAWGATLGAALVLFSFSASHGWVRLTVPEPLGLLCVLGAALLATQVRHARRWNAMAIGSGVLMMLAIFAKEMFVAWAPVVAYLGCFLGEDGRLEAIRRPNARGWWVTLAVGAGAALASIPVLLTIRGVKAEGYASRFGSGGISMERAADIAQRMLLPWPAGVGGGGAVMILPALCFVVAIAIGALAARGDAEWAPHARRATALGIAIPLIGTVLYLPWPVYWPSYGIAFLVGPALLLGIAVTSAERASIRTGWAARAAAFLCIALVIGPSAHLANLMATRQEVDAGLARALLSHRDADSVVVALVVPPRSASGAIGPAMRDYALLVSPGAVLPPAIDAQCADAAARGKRSGGLGRTVVISYLDQCGPITGATLTLQRSFAYFDLDHFWMARDSIRADLFDPMARPVR